jgi:hypothetical protein
MWRKLLAFSPSVCDLLQRLNLCEIGAVLPWKTHSKCQFAASENQTLLMGLNKFVAVLFHISGPRMVKFDTSEPT